MLLSAVLCTLLFPKQLSIAFFLSPLLLSLRLALIKVAFAMVMLYEMLCKKLFYVKLEANDLNTEAKGQDECLQLTVVT